MECSDWVPIIISFVGLVLMVFFGDMAAYRASEKHQKKLSHQARLTALGSLLAEVERIRCAVDHNRCIEKNSGHLYDFVRMPIAAFETAFVSGNPTVLGDYGGYAKLLGTVTDYLTRAYAINACIDLYLSLMTNVKDIEGAKISCLWDKIKRKSKDVADKLPQLQAALKQWETAL